MGAYGALLGTIKNFGAIVQGASSVCFGVDGALIALYAMFLGAGLDQQLKIPEFGAFFWMRIGIIAFHIIIDVVQSLCGAGKDTVGTMAHMASLVAGFCYVILVLPPMGDGSLFDSQQPYLINCGITSPTYVTMESATTQCIAFFRRGNGMEVATAQRLAIGILGGDVFALFQCGETPGPKEEVESHDKALLNVRQQQISALREDVTRLERLLQNMPSLGNTPAATPGDVTHVE